MTPTPSPDVYYATPCLTGRHDYGVLEATLLDIDVCMGLGITKNTLVRLHGVHSGFPYGASAVLARMFRDAAISFISEAYLYRPSNTFVIEVVRDRELVVPEVRLWRTLDDKSLGEYLLDRGCAVAK